ncbi:STAS domain-containing protein [Nonomuraea pusilla]|uniref:Anti-sigma factor antagonist n=1 Tax=Nonomuraea pusilla TaxID=46177 RepID=A0A1H7I990_9ACTN|nr:STAS domain-containing protein [Nonomuraea pusilla]SEK59066.1 anti-anti-sigma factor [Nonomuraea pusilla]
MIQNLLAHPEPLRDDLPPGIPAHGVHPDLARAVPVLRSERPVTVIDVFPLGRADPSAPTVIRLTGEIDAFSSAALRRRLLGVLQSSTSLLILDLSALTFCDAAGLAVLVGVQRRARPMGVTLALAAPRPYLSRLLHVTGLDRSLPVLA